MKNIALLLIDVINDLEFTGNETLLTEIPALARNLRALKEAAQKANVPIIYLNDNFDKWRSDFNELLQYCLNNDVKGKALAAALRPDSNDFFVLKPRHSGFYGTPLEILLKRLDITKLILTGIAADICVLYTANDAYMRNFEIIVISDCIASNTPADKEHALGKMQKLLKASIYTAGQLIQVLEKDKEEAN